LAERNKKLEERKAAREKLIADRKALAEEKKLAMEARKKQAKLEKDASKNGTSLPPKTVSAKNNDSISVSGTEPSKVIPKKAIDSTLIHKKQKAAEDRAKVLADRKKALDDRKRQIQQAKDSKKVPAEKSDKDSIANKKEPRINSQIVKETNVDTLEVKKKPKSAEDRAKILADRKKAIEDKKKKALEDREAAKKAKEKKEN
jgi:hypothetical protein